MKNPSRGDWAEHVNNSVSIHSHIKSEWTKKEGTNDGRVSVSFPGKGQESFPF